MIESFLPQIHEMVLALHKKLIKNTQDASPPSINFKQTSQHLWAEISREVDALQTKHYSVMRSHFNSIPGRAQLKDLFAKINETAKAIAIYSAMLELSRESYHGGLNSEMGHSTLMFLALFKQFSTKDILIECLEMTHPSSPETIKSLVLINRRGNLNHTSTWGDNFIIIDSQTNCVTRPEPSSDRSFFNRLFGRLFGGDSLTSQNDSKFDVSFDNRFGLHDLRTYPEGHILHDFERDIFNLFFNRLEHTTKLENLGGLDLPWLSVDKITDVSQSALIRNSILTNKDAASPQGASASPQGASDSVFSLIN